MAKKFHCSAWEIIKRLANLVVSDFSAYVNGEVVVIDVGEWLKALDSNLLEAIPEELWDQTRNDDDKS
jgi:hypothetical protein